MSEERIGEILCDLGLLTSQQLAKALELQKKDGQPIGKLLVSLGFIESEDVIIGLSEQQYGLKKRSDKKSK